MSIHVRPVGRQDQILVVKKIGSATRGRFPLVLILFALSAISAAAATGKTLYSFNWFP
jgi:hypothetical protein